MKKFLPLLVALLLLLAALVGCADKLPQSAPDTETTYLQRIAELEAALAQEKEARYISDAAHAATIKELQSKLDALTANAPSAPNGGDLVFHYKLQDGKAVITGFSGASTLVSIPATLDGHPVIAIGERAFEGQNVAAVVLPESLESIGWFAFYNCASLMDVTIPATVTSIGYAVFDGCPNVTLICPKDSYAAQYAASYGIPTLIP